MDLIITMVKPDALLMFQLLSVGGFLTTFSKNMCNTKKWLEINNLFFHTKILFSLA